VQAGEAREAAAGQDHGDAAQRHHRPEPLHRPHHRAQHQKRQHQRHQRPGGIHQRGVDGIRVAQAQIKHALKPGHAAEGHEAQAPEILAQRRLVGAPQHTHQHGQQHQRHRPAHGHDQAGPEKIAQRAADHHVAGPEHAGEV
jgi:hypothetical protein